MKLEIIAIEEIDKTELSDSAIIVVLNQTPSIDEQDQLFDDSVILIF